MKKKVIASLILPLFLLVPDGLFAQRSFTAEVVEVQKGKEKRYTVYSDGQQYRYNIKEGDQEGAVIVRPSEKVTSILFFDKQFVHHTETSSMMSLMNDPYQAFNQARLYYSSKEVGNEMIQGYHTEVVELWAQDQKVQTAWISAELNFMLKMVNHMRAETYVELVNIRQQTLDPELFMIPEVYTEVDEQMRVKIPEPPAPETWQVSTVDLPFNGEISRGERIVFTIDYDEYSNFVLSNELESPSKVVWHIHKDGVKKPVKDQGTDSYRTKRLLAGEHKSLTFTWKKGNEIQLECHEGTMHVEVKPEAKEHQ